MPELLPEGLVRFLPATEATKAALVWFSDGHCYAVDGVDLVAPSTVRINGHRTDVPDWKQRRRWGPNDAGPRGRISVPAGEILPMVLHADAAADDDE